MTLSTDYKNSRDYSPGQLEAITAVMGWHQYGIPVIIPMITAAPSSLVMRVN